MAKTNTAPQTMQADAYTKAEAAPTETTAPANTTDTTSPETTCEVAPVNAGCEPKLNKLLSLEERAKYHAFDKVGSVSNRAAQFAHALLQNPNIERFLAGPPLSLARTVDGDLNNPAEHLAERCWSFAYAFVRRLERLEAEAIEQHARDYIAQHQEAEALAANIAAGEPTE